MTGSNPSILSHVSLGTNDLDRSAKFYDAVMAAIGGKRLMEHPGAIAFGRIYPEFWIQAPFDQGPATVGNGVHIAFFADNKDQVRAFFAAAVAAGAAPDGEPGPRPLYGAPYYGCFVRDPDGHKIEAVFWDMALMHKLEGG